MELLQQKCGWALGRQQDWKTTRIRSLPSFHFLWMFAHYSLCRPIFFPLLVNMVEGGCSIAPNFTCSGHGESCLVFILGSRIRLAPLASGGSPNRQLQLGGDSVRTGSSDRSLPQRAQPLRLAVRAVPNEKKIFMTRADTLQNISTIFCPSLTQNNYILYASS